METKAWTLKRVLIAMARLKHGDKVESCYGKSWKECITVFNGAVQLWYNDASNSTHIVSISIR